MLDTVIVGAGLSGLALARNLQRQGREFALYEARHRLGGRILSVAAAGMMLDLGPAWYWPSTQPRMVRLVAELGLQAYDQHDQGTVLSLADADKAPEPYSTKGVHGGAQRLAGGMTSLVEALAAKLPPTALHLEHVLTAVIGRGDHVELHFGTADGVRIVAARNVVLTVPPRLLEQHVRFEPALDESVRRSMRATHTWMADQAKVVVTYPHAFWRAAGYAGNAFVTHEQALFYETFDACDAAGQRAALGGFVALSPALRTSFAAGMSILVASQLVQLFGSEADDGEQYMQDWAQEVHTSSSLDQSPPTSHPAYDDATLRKPLWNSRLYFCGSETAGYAGGYMEGALESGERVAYLLASEIAASRVASSRAEPSIADLK